MCLPSRFQGHRATGMVPLNRQVVLAIVFHQVSLLAVVRATLCNLIRNGLCGVSQGTTIKVWSGRILIIEGVAF